MPLICTTGAASARGFGEFYQRDPISVTGWTSKIALYTTLLTKDVGNNIYIAKNATAGLIKIAPDGTILWQNNFTQSSYSIVIAGIQAINSTSVAIAGQGGQYPILPILSVINSDGTHSYSRYFNANSYSSFDRLAVSESGSLFASGRVSASGTCLFRVYNGSTVAKKTYSNAYYNLSFIGTGASDTSYLGSDSTSVPILTKLDSGLSILWKLNGSFLITKVIESNGFLYAIGSGYLLKFNASNGTLVWGISLPVTSIALDGSDNIYAAGYTSFNQKGFVLKFNSSGSLIWQRSVLISGLTSPYFYTIVSSISVNNSNNTFCIQFSSNDTSSGYSLLLSVPNDGTLTGTYTVGGTSFVYDTASVSYSPFSPTFSSLSSSLGASTVTDSATSLSPSATSIAYNRLSIP